MAKVGVILSGCGVFDGSEVHEAVLILLALDEAGAEVVCAAPNIAQTRVVNHATGKSVMESRNVLEESARIARGNIIPLAELDVDGLDALVLPGGYGAALNLCDFGIKGDKCRVDGEVERVIRAAHAARKPIGAVCISPVVIAQVLGSASVTVTIGDDVATAAKIEQMGARHVNCAVEDVTIDTQNRVVTSPAYMLAGSIRQLRGGIEEMVRVVLEFAKTNPTAASRS